MTVVHSERGTVGLDQRRTALPVYFGPEGRKLFGWFHRPASAPTGPAMVICPPLGYPMIISHRGLRHLAAAAAGQGIPTLRFDYHGTGDSSGTDHDPGRIDAWIASVDQAIEEALRLSGSGRVVLAGLRVGCLFAAAAASKRSDVAGLIAWAPVTSGRSEVRELRAVERLMKGYDPAIGELPGGAVMSAGFMFSRETIDELRELDVRRLGRAPAPAALVVPRDDLTDDDKFAQAREHLGADVTRAPLPGYSGMMRDAHATLVPDEAIQGILQWAAEVTGDATAAEGAYPRAMPLEDSTEAEQERLRTSIRLARDIEEVTFLGSEGRLFGILTRPVSGAAPGRPGIILASAGAVHHIGANRLYVSMARTWAELGFPVLRLDIGGIGDSLPFPGMEENDTYSSRAVLDITEAAAMMAEESRGAGIVVAGLCSGAHAAFHSGLTLDGIVGIIMMNPIVFYWKPSDALEVAAWMTHKEVQRYQQRITSLDSWQKVLKGEVDLLHAARTVGSWIHSRVLARGQAALRSVGRRSAEDPTEVDIVRDLGRISARGVDIVLVFSQGEPGLSQLRAHHRDALDHLKRLPGFTYYAVDWPGHTFPSAQAQEALLGSLTQHLTETFPVRRAWAMRHSQT